MGLNRYARKLQSSGMLVTAMVVGATLLAVPVHACSGDCDANGVVSVNELIVMVNMALGSRDMSACPVADANGDGKITINELVMATGQALSGCAPDATPTVGEEPTATATPGDGCNGGSFNSTFEAIQKVVFEQHSCTESVCHGSLGHQGGLVLTPDVAYQNLFEVQSTGSSLPRVQPGDKDRSFLWLKLAAATDPSQLPQGFHLFGQPMPNGLPPLSKDELEAVRLWIYGGASQTGTVAGTETLLNACLPKPEPILIDPLAAPAENTGVQFTMPPWHLEAHSEHEICFATYYDITDQVPDKYKDPSGQFFRFATTELRQDPSSHHLILNRYFGPADINLHDASFGAWTCNGGDHAGDTCEPTDLTSCGTGICTSAIKQSFACIGFGPRVSGGIAAVPIGGAQAAQSFNQYADGVFAQIPMKGVLYWNSHAFNLTDTDTTMHAWLNYFFSDAQKYGVSPIFDRSMIFSANAAPFTTQTICQDFVLPQRARLFNLSSHTHKHGKHFTVTLPDGSTIYESFVYNDPANITYDPPLAFDSADPAQRTLHFCSLYNNGVKLDGTPDVDLVTRASLVPTSAQGTIGRCKPIACVSGKVGAACNGVGDDRTCDSSLNANDGFCDACPITGGRAPRTKCSS